MKLKVIVTILALAAVSLVIAVFVNRKTIAEQTTSISSFSNQWEAASANVSNLTQTKQALEKDLGKRNTEFLSLTNAYTQALGALVKTETELKQTETELKQTENSLKLTQEEVAARDAKIAALETQNKELDTKSAELSTAITTLTAQIEATQQKLTTSEGDKELLQNELNRLMAAKVELERQLNDLVYLKAQVAHLKAELSISRRLEWIRKGLFSPGEQKGATLLMQNSTAKPAEKTNNYDLNVEINSDGSVKIIPALTNTPAAK